MTQKSTIKKMPNFPNLYYTKGKSTYLLYSFAYKNNCVLNSNLSKIGAVLPPKHLLSPFTTFFGTQLKSVT